MRHTKLEQLLQPLVNDLGYELWACDYLSQGKHSILRIYIDTDKPEGITIDDCTTVSHEVSALLDVEDPISGFYSLEVSSPGLDRPLYTAAHYQRFVGSGVFIKLNKPVAGTKKLQGIIVSADDNTIIVDVDGTEQPIESANIVKANLIV